MTQKIDNDQFGFSHEPAYEPIQHVHFQALTLRDYLAGQALSGAASIQLTEEEMAGLGTADDARAALAKHAYALADAMLAERAKRNGP